MKTIAMRDFRLQGEKALEGIDFDRELPVLTDRGGMRFFLVPVREDSIREQEDELQRISALRSLSDYQKQAQSSGLDNMTNDEIQAEVKAARKTVTNRIKKREA